MREFVLRARKAPTTPGFRLDKQPPHRHLEIIAHCVVNSLFYAASVRQDTRFHVVMEGPASPPKTITWDGDRLGTLDGLDEGSIWTVMRRALEKGKGLTLDQEDESQPGVWIAKRSFEQLVKERAMQGQLYYLRPDGEDIRRTTLVPCSCFVFTDHLAMPRKTDRFLERLGARPLSVGPRMLYASQCIAVVHNELDRWEQDAADDAVVARGRTDMHAGS